MRISKGNLSSRTAVRVFLVAVLALVVGIATIERPREARADASNGTFQFSAGTYGVTEGQSAVLTMTRTGGSVGTVNVTYTVAGSGGSPATGGGVDFGVSGGTVTFFNGETSKQLLIPTTDDGATEAAETFTVSITGFSGSPTGLVGGTNNAAVVTITDNDGPGIAVTPISGLVTTEGGGTAQFTVRLNSLPTGNVTIALTSDNLAEGTVSPASLTFTNANGTTPQTVTVTGVNDALIDGNIAYNIITAPAASGDPAYNALDASDVSVTNNDNEALSANVTPQTLTTSETGGNVTFTIALSALPNVNVTINLVSGDTTEGTVSPASLTFTTANATTPQTVTVTPQDDAIGDGNITYTITTTVATAAFSALPVADVSVTNLDNEALVIVTPQSGLVTSEAGTQATFTVALSSQPAAAVTISLASSDTTEGTVFPSLLTFSPGSATTPQTVTVTGVSDALADGSVAYSIITGATSSTDANWNNIAVPDVSVTNTDINTLVTITPQTGLTTTEAGGQATFTVNLNTLPAANVVITLTSDDLSEGTVFPATLTFTPLNGTTAQVVTVTGVNDSLTDGNIVYSIVTSNTVSTDPAYNNLVLPNVIVTNLDDDGTIIVTPTSGLVTTEAGGQATFTVRLNTLPTSSVTITMTSSDTTEGTISPQTLTFTTLNGTTAQTVTVTGVADALVDGNVAYTIITNAAVSLDAAYNGVNPTDVSVTNNDVATVERHTYTLNLTWTLLTWVGPNGTSVLTALQGIESPDDTLTNNVLSIVTAVLRWNQVTQRWEFWFPTGANVPGANDYTNFENGRAYFIALTSNGSWTIRR